MCLNEIKPIFGLDKARLGFRQSETWFLTKQDGVSDKASRGFGQSETQIEVSLVASLVMIVSNKCWQTPKTGFLALRLICLD